jgi:hypothetical protein
MRAHPFVPDLNLDVGIRNQVEVPGRMPRRTAFGGLDQKVVAVPSVDQRALPLPARAPTRRRQDQRLRPLPVVTLLASGRKISIDMLLSDERHQAALSSASAATWAQAS